MAATSIFALDQCCRASAACRELRRLPGAGSPCRSQTPHPQAPAGRAAIGSFCVNGRALVYAIDEAVAVAVNLATIRVDLAAGRVPGHLSLLSTTPSPSLSASLGAGAGPEPVPGRYGHHAFLVQKRTSGTTDRFVELMRGGLAGRATHIGRIIEPFLRMAVITPADISAAPER